MNTSANVSQRTFFVYFIAASIIGGILLAMLSFYLPTWSEERGWLKIGKAISAGERLNPVAPKSDYPSSFQAFPIGLFIYAGMSPIDASRLVGILLAIAGTFFFGLFAVQVSNGKAVAIFGSMLLSLLTYSTGFYVMTGWHEVTHINLLCGAATYFLYSIFGSGEKNTLNAVGLGAALGLSLWTLYTPALAACGLIFVLLCLPSKVVHWKFKTWVFCSLVVTTAPLIIGIARSKGEWLHRHFLWIVQGGEWEATKYSAQNPFSDAMLRTLERIWLTIVPHPTDHSFDLAMGIFPEWPILVLALVGLIISFFNLKQIVVVTIPFFITFVGLVLSNATPWRASILSFYVILYAIIGLGFIANVRLRNGGAKTIAIVCLPLLLAWQAGLFLSALTQVQRVAKVRFFDGQIASKIYSECGSLIADPKVSIAALDHMSLILLESMLPGVRAFKFVPQDSPNYRELEDSNAEVLIALQPDPKEVQKGFEHYKIACEGVLGDHTFYLGKKS